MASLPRGRKHRSSTNRSNAPPLDGSAEQLESCINTIREEAATAATAGDALNNVINLLEKAVVVEALQDHFRRLHGFQAVLNIARRQTAAATQDAGDLETLSVAIRNLKHVFTILVLAFKDHEGNRRYFSRRVESGGWRALGDMLSSMQPAFASDASAERVEWLHASLLNSLMAVATGDRQLQIFHDDGQRNLSDGAATQLSLARVVAPEVVSLAFSFCCESAIASDLHPRERQVLLEATSVLTKSSSANVRVLTTSGLVEVLLEDSDTESAPSDDDDHRSAILVRLLNANFGNLKTAESLLVKACKSQAARRIIERVAEGPVQVPCVSFDLSVRKHAALEVSSLPRNFPPPTGYTLEMWIKVTNFDDRQHTTLFGAFDATQTCFVLAYLERGSQQLILQTSVTSTTPSVRFKRARFEAGQWYHIVLVHRPPKAGEFGEALLLVNGRYVERKERCLYPKAAPYDDSHSNGAPFPPESNTRFPVQAFFGTPQDLSGGSKDRIVQSRWALATSHLYDCCISKDLVAVHHALGPAYSGNFQDRVGQLLTYDASASLNRHNEEVYGDKAEKSGIVTAIQRRGIDTLHEGGHLLSVFSAATINTDGCFAHELSLLGALSGAASKQLSSITRTGNTVVVNAYRPLISDALIRPSGIGFLTGQASAHTPRSIDDATWKLAGFLGIHLALIDSASTSQALLSSVKTLFNCVDVNFRASEVMEKDQGYSIVVTILREKLGFTNMTNSAPKTSKAIAFATAHERNTLMADLLDAVLQFLDLHPAKPTLGLLKNPLAYRSFLIDFDIWRSGSQATQKKYFHQFCWLLIGNANFDFNSKRLTKMRIVKRFLDALRSDHVHGDNLEAALEAFKALYLHVAGKTDHRDLATFIGYCFQESRISTELNQPTRRLTIRMELPRRRTGSPPVTEQVRLVRQAEESLRDSAVKKGRLGQALLQTYTDLICEPGSASMLRRFYRNVPVSWLLHLLDEADGDSAVSAFKIASRGIVGIGPDFLSRLLSKGSGTQVIRTRLREQVAKPEIWYCCLAVLFGMDIAAIDTKQQITLEYLLRTFPPQAVRLANQDCMTWIMGLLDRATSLQGDDKSDRRGDENDLPAEAVAEYLLALHQANLPVRDLLGSSASLRELLRMLYPVITSSSVTSPSTELGHLDDQIASRSRAASVRAQAQPIETRPSIARKGSSMTLPERPSPRRIPTPRRPSSFVLIDAEDASDLHLSAHFNPAMAPISEHTVREQTLTPMNNHLLDLVIAILIDHACLRKDFSGFGLFFKAPPGDRVYQAAFESFLLQRAMKALWSHLSDHPQLLQAPRTLTNMARYALHMAEAVFEGWFIDGAQPLVDFTGNILDYVQQPEIASIKDVRLCSQAVTTIRTVFLRIILLRLSELDESDSDAESIKFLKQLTYWQTILFAPENQEVPFIRLICYVLYTKLVSSSPNVRSAAAGLFRMLLVQKPTEAATILVHGADIDQKHLSTGFMKLATHDDDELLQWIDDRRIALDKFFLETLSKYWEEFVEGENQKTEESARIRLAKRKEKLKQWQADETAEEEVLQQAERATGHWRINSHAQDRMKLHRSLQDQQENITHLSMAMSRQQDLLRQPCGLFPDPATPKWQLDQTESRDRMRMRLLRDSERDMQMYQPKRKASERLSNTPYRGAMRSPSGNSISSATQSPMRAGSMRKASPLLQNDGTFGDEAASPLLEGDFELVDDPKEDEEIYEDKNRKIMRSVERGDSIKSVHNMSRIVGLEASEGLLIVGKKWLYMRDGMFQRSDGEIVSIGNAPPEERDAYVQMISGREIRSSRATQAAQTTDAARSWPWRDVLSISKRRFLFRDVAIEVFFNDGRSYLLIFTSPATRNTVYTNIANQAPHIIGPSSSVSEEDQWRIDCLRSPDDVPQTLGNRFASAFNSTSYNSASRKWARGEISNFHYLMLVNTMAGRTFNDLTQYPVFPWVLADYSSDELDLDDPRAYRDLRKPMGCQNADRESDFRERYQTFAEMGDERPFNYGTHYSSAMIVTSYLIRLQPFVQSYLLLQGGSFDHADRLFDSIEKAWTSSSKQNMTDVRELTPEFYYLPEFLTNINGYDFGIKEGSGQAIGDVHLPKWAKGDPHLFVRKHREALESQYVSDHLHEWIDLVFGYKQKGEAAVEAVNVFHPLSYHGAKDLDTIDDPVERLATVGMIHNFGQTPHQVFARPHPRREVDKHSISRLDTQADTLTKLPRPATDIQERVTTIMYRSATQRLLPAGSSKLYAPPYGRFFVQWLYADNSLRFFDSDNRKLLGLYEELHIGPISTAHFLDSKTLITGGTDCTIGIFDLASLPNEQIDLRPRQYLFGHRAAVTHLSASRAFSTLASAGADGKVIMWDLNRHDCIRVLLTADEGRRVDALKINDLTGRIFVSSGGTAQLYTLNGHKLLEQRICEAEDTVTCCAFYEGVGSEWVKAEILFTGHRRGLVKVWSLINLDDGSWYLHLIKHLTHADPAKEGLVGYTCPAVSAVLPREKGVFVGDESGQVWEWDCVVRQGR